MASDEQFGKWLVSVNLAHTDRHDRLAAMWASADRDRFHAVRRAHPSVRTVRGLHAKWKEGDKPKPATKEVPGKVHRKNLRG